MLVPVSAKLSYAQIELQRPKETRLIGVVDLTLRPALHFDPDGAFAGDGVLRRLLGK